MSDIGILQYREWGVLGRGGRKRLCASLAQNAPRHARPDGWASGPVLSFVPSGLMLLQGVSHSEGFVKANYGKSFGEEGAGSKVRKMGQKNWKRVVGGQPE